MSVDLSLIIPNDCRSIRDKSESRKCFDDLINNIKHYFHGKNFITDIEIIEDDDPDWECYEYSFQIPLLNTVVYLNSGYWIIDFFCRYSYYFEPLGKDILGNPRIWPRDLCFNVLLLFGIKGAYICADYYGSDCDLFGKDKVTIDDWKKYSNFKQEDKVYDFNIKDFPINHDGYYNSISDYKNKYYDDFKQCHQVFDILKNRFPEYEILVYKTPLDNYLLVAKGDNLFFINKENGNRLTDFPVDFCNAKFNGAGVQIFRGEESAFFNSEGEQLTDFRIGDFSWKWGYSDEDYLRGQKDKYRQIIIDHVTNRLFLSDGTDVTCMRWSEEHKDLIKNKLFIIRDKQRKKR